MRYLLLLTAIVIAGCDSNPVSTSTALEDQPTDNPIEQTPDSLTYRVISSGAIDWMSFSDLPGAGPGSIQGLPGTDWKWKVAWFEGLKTIAAQTQGLTDSVVTEIYEDDLLVARTAKYAEPWDFSFLRTGSVTGADSIEFDVRGNGNPGMFRLTIDGSEVSASPQFIGYVSAGSKVHFEIVEEGRGQFQVGMSYWTLDGRNPILFFDGGVGDLKPYVREIDFQP